MILSPLETLAMGMLLEQWVLLLNAVGRSCFYAALGGENVVFGLSILLSS